MRSPPRLARGRPGWRHDFYSPRTGEHLIFDRGDDKGFRDPSDGSVFATPSIRAAWILLQHEGTYRLMRTMGLLYGLTGREAYSDWVARGLRQAAHFISLAVRSEGHQDAIYYQPLYDAQVILLLANCYDLTRGSPSYDSDEEELILGMFKAGSRSLFEHHRNSETHNITCYVTAALASVGRELGRPELVEEALSEDARGLLGLLGHGLKRGPKGAPDGFWFEGTTFYHFYAMFPLLHLFELAKDFGIEGRRLSGVRRDLIAMARVGALLADEHLRLAWLGDLGSPRLPGLPGFSHLYEYCAGVLDPAFSSTLAACIDAGAPRGMSALAFGPDHLGKPRTTRRSRILGPSGIAILRAATTNGSFFVVFRSGPHGAGHDHLDKLGIVLHAMGKALASDLGTAGYSLVDFKKYCISTFSHNTLMVDDKDQRRVKDAWIAGDGHRGARGVIRDAYEGTVLERSVRLDPPRLEVTDRFSSAEDHIFGWMFHGNGEMEVDILEGKEGPGLPPLPTDRSFAYLRDRSRFPSAVKAKAKWSIGGSVVLSCESTWDRDFECTSGVTPSNPMTCSRGTLVMRSKAKKAKVRSVFTVQRR